MTVLSTLCRVGRELYVKLLYFERGDHYYNHYWQGEKDGWHKLQRERDVNCIVCLSLQT